MILLSSLASILGNKTLKQWLNDVQMGLYQHFYTALYDLETQEFDLFYLFGVGQKVNSRVDP